jgi:enoyl-CoA hydratase/carnithine racemase
MELTLAVHDVRAPAALNALSVSALHADLQAAFASRAPVVRLQGAGNGVFCRGLDLTAPADEPSHTSAFAALLSDVMDSPKPTVAEVDGEALGGGLGLAAACDWVLASDRATFALPELLWGLAPAIIWPVITERMQPPIARAWLLTGHARSAEEARLAGLVDEIAQGSLERAIERRARVLMRLESGALVHLRRWARTSRGLALRDALAHGAAITSERLQDPAVQSRLAAYQRGEAPWRS